MSASSTEAPSPSVQAIVNEKLVGVEALASTPTRADVVEAEKAMAEVLKLAALPEGKGTLDMTRVYLAQARVSIAKFLTSDGRTSEDALASARQAFQLALESADVASPEGAQRWLDAIKGKLAVAVTQLQKLGSNASIEQVMPVLRQARKDLDDATRNVPRAVTRVWDEFRPKQERALRTQFIDRTEAWVETRQREWNTIDVMNPKYPEAVATTELAILEETVGLFKVDDRYEVEADPLRFRVAALLRCMSLLDRAKRLNPKVYEHAMAALELLEPIDAAEEPRVEGLRERLNYTLGWLALKEGSRAPAARESAS